jgi:hypothetical protein
MNVSTEAGNKSHPQINYNEGAPEVKDQKPWKVNSIRFQQQ